MRHSVDGRKFGRNSSHRSAMLKNLALAVIEKEQITTTVEKAKEARRVVDRLITLGKQDTLHSRRLAFDRTRSRTIVGKLFGELAERYKARNGGYTRILKLSDLRRGDAAEMAILELVDHPVIKRGKTTDSKKAEGENTAAAQPKDTMAKFKKMFSGSKSKKEGGASGPQKAQSTRSTPRKTMAGTSNKSGGSS